MTFADSQPHSTARDRAAKAAERISTGRVSRIAFIASDAQEARTAQRRLVHAYGNTPVDDADVVVALGGDGLMLQCLHQLMGRGVPIYGMNRGSVGFLMNEYDERDLPTRLAAAELSVIHPLAMTAIDRDGAAHNALAINEVSLFRQRHQAAKIAVSVDDKLRLEELVCDGVLVSTPAGSTAYNLSAHGPILPITAQLLALTPISPFRPRRWRGAIVGDTAKISFRVLEPEKRPVSAVADHKEIRFVSQVSVREEAGIDLHMLFDPGRALEERILIEQFKY
ncbi:MAG: NAD kinase [Pseudomonadota bacterium]